jgi:exonuclease SbcD
MIRILHTADWHFSAEKLEKCLNSAEFIIAQSLAIKPDLHVIAGDWWDKRQSLNTSSAIIPALGVMKRLAEISPIVMVIGNAAHDNPGSLEIFRDLNTAFPIYVTDRAETILFTEYEGHSFFQGTPGFYGPDSDIAVLHLFPYPTKQWFLAGKENLSIDESNQLIQDALRKIFTGFGAISMEAKCPVIFVGHCNVSGALLSSGQTLLGQDIMISKHDLELARADYYALGHIHKAQEVGRNMWYSGSIYHCNFGEVEKKTFRLIEFQGQGTNLGASSTERRGWPDQRQDTIYIPSRPLVLLEADIIHPIENDPGTGLDITSGDPRFIEDAEVRIRVHGSKEEQLHWTDEEIHETFPGAFSYQIERIITPEERIRSSEIVKAKTLPEKVLEWGNSIQKSIPADVLGLAGDVERSVVS